MPSRRCALAILLDILAGQPTKIDIFVEAAKEQAREVGDGLLDAIEHVTPELARLEAMARVITSEVGNGPLAERVALGWLVRNQTRARRSTVSIARLVCSPCGERPELLRRSEGTC